MTQIRAVRLWTLAFRKEVQKVRRNVSFRESVCRAGAQCCGDLDSWRSVEEEMRRNVSLASMCLFPWPSLPGQAKGARVVLAQRCSGLAQCSPATLVALVGVCVIVSESTPSRRARRRSFASRKREAVPAHGMPRGTYCRNASLSTRSERDIWSDPALSVPNRNNVCRQLILIMISSKF